MTDTLITTDELVFIEAYFHHGTPVSQIAKRLARARQTVHNVITHLKAGHTVIKMRTLSCPRKLDFRSKFRGALHLPCRLFFNILKKPDPLTNLVQRTFISPIQASLATLL